MQEQTFEQLRVKLAAAEAQIQQLQQANEEAWAEFASNLQRFLVLTTLLLTLALIFFVSLPLLDLLVLIWLDVAGVAGS